MAYQATIRVTFAVNRTTTERCSEIASEFSDFSVSYSSCPSVVVLQYDMENSFLDNDFCIVCESQQLLLVMPISFFSPARCDINNVIDCAQYKTTLQNI